MRVHVCAAFLCWCSTSRSESGGDVGTTGTGSEDGESGPGARYDDDDEEEGDDDDLGEDEEVEDTFGVRVRVP